MHVRRRADNPNRALAKSRFSRSVPVTVDLVALYTDQALVQDLLCAAVVPEREQCQSPARIQGFTGSRTWNEVVLHWARDGRRNRSGLPASVLAESLVAWVAEQTPGPPRLVTEGLDATGFLAATPLSGPSTN
ncbi:hypothetical protein ACFT8P_26400 [Streptomyces sp. NPDC057101]|uniref:hypothetical protein n=1 Tax=Streptomyces sp. NPDC057101 TaxID=3346020 RepID=UPI00362984EA